MDGGLVSRPTDLSTLWAIVSALLRGLVLPLATLLPWVRELVLTDFFFLHGATKILLFTTCPVAGVRGAYEIISDVRPV
jgi:hypothetical protein